MIVVNCLIEPCEIELLTIDELCLLNVYNKQKWVNIIERYNGYVVSDILLPSNQKINLSDELKFYFRLRGIEVLSFTYSVKFSNVVLKIDNRLMPLTPLLLGLFMNDIRFDEYIKIKNYICSVYKDVILKDEYVVFDNMKDYKKFEDYMKNFAITIFPDEKYNKEI